MRLGEQLADSQVVGERESALVVEERLVGLSDGLVLRGLVALRGELGA